MTKINANSIRAGNILEHNGRLWVVAKQPVHTMPGKGGAFVQVEMKDLIHGTKLNERFRSSEDITKVTLDQKEYQYLFIEDNILTLMDVETYEQINVHKDLLGEKLQYLQDNMILTVESYEEKPLNITVPDHVTLLVVEAEPVVKNQTASSSYKPAVLENGQRIMVPPHINSGYKIVVKTEDHSYVERAKE